MVSALVAAGWVKRREDKEDGRGVIVTITAKGRRIYERSAERSLKQVTGALEELAPEQLTAIEALLSALERGGTKNL